MTRIFVPADAQAVALGADRVAAAVASSAEAKGVVLCIVRTGSRGLFWLEPMVEVETPSGRVAYGPVKPADVDGLLAAGLLDGKDHPLRLGDPEALPYLARQTRLTFARCGLVDPVSADDYVAHGGYAGLARALALDGTGIVDEIKLSGLRGRGGAGFPTGIKWSTVLLAEATRNTSSATPTRATAAPSPTAC